eukprot:2709683-Karenia_brevis.AAC.1
MGNMRLLDLANLKAPLLDQRSKEAPGKEPTGRPIFPNGEDGMNQNGLPDDPEMTDGNNGASNGPASI